jgi:hypothetical protein
MRASSLALVMPSSVTAPALALKAPNAANPTARPNQWRSLFDMKILLVDDPTNHRGRVWRLASAV